MDLKIGMVKRTCEFLNLMKSRNVPIKCIHLDPVGEILLSNLECRALIGKLFNSSNSNNLAELAFPFLSGKARAMMSAAFIPSKIHRGDTLCNAT